MDITLYDMTRLFQGYWPGSSRQTPEIMQEHFSQANEMNVSLIDFENGIKEYRKCKTGHFMPLAKDLRPFLYSKSLSTLDSYESSKFTLFVDMVIDIGWTEALRAVYADFPAIAAVLEDKGISQGSLEYSGFSEFLQQFIGLIHYAKNPQMAYQWAADNTKNPRAKAFYQRKEKFFSAATPEQGCRYFTILRKGQDEK